MPKHFASITASKAFFIDSFFLKAQRLSRIQKKKLLKINQNLKKQSSLESFTYLSGRNPCQNLDFIFLYHLNKRLDRLKKINITLGRLERYEIHFVQIMYRHRSHNITDRGLSYVAKILRKKKHLQYIQLFLKW